MFWPGISLWIKSHTNSSWCPNIDQFQVIYLLLQNFWNISKSKNYANLSNTNKGSNETIFLLKFSKINVTKAKKLLKIQKYPTARTDLKSNKYPTFVIQIQCTKQVYLKTVRIFKFYQKSCLLPLVSSQRRHSHCSLLFIGIFTLWGTSCIE